MATLAEIDEWRGLAQHRLFQYNIDYTQSLAGQAMTPEAANYDWSGVCFRQNSNFIRSGETEPEGFTYGRPCALVSEHFSIGCWHVCPIAGTVCYWKAPDGSEKSATVTSLTRVVMDELGLDIGIQYYATPPDAALKRYQIGLGPELMKDYAVFNPELAGNLWGFLLRGDKANGDMIYFKSGYWTDVPVTYGSGMPHFIGVNGELVLLGVNSTGGAFAGLTEAQDEINAIITDLPTPTQLPNSDRVNPLLKVLYGD